MQTLFRAVVCALIAIPTTGLSQSFDFQDPSAGAYPIVLTPTRLRQSLADVPASVTVITADMIEKFGIRSVPDALRLVPGMAITQPLGTNYRINYHGTTVLSPRRMNVLIDGISVYRPAFARVDWKELPVVIEDIDRIEVTRGPNSAAYGPNSLTATVNIITKHPNDVGRGMIAATAGSLDSLDATARVAANIGQTALRLTVNREQDDGYDFISRSPDPHDSTRLNRFNFRSVTPFGTSTTLDIFAAFVDGTKEEPFIDAFQRSFPDNRIKDTYLGATLTTNFTPTHQLQVRGNYTENRIRQEWMTCPPAAALLPELFTLYRANPRYADTILAGRIPTGGTARDNALAAAALAAIQRLGLAAARRPTCTTPNQNVNQSRSDFELQDTYVLSNALRVVGGIGAREDRGTSQTFVAGTVSNSSYRAFGNVEYKPTSWVNINIGGYYEHEDISGSSFSPRVAANFHLSPDQTIRAVFSKGTRSPDFFEQRANWTYTVSDATPPVNGATNVRFYQSAVAPGGLREERITSRELGYLLRIPRLALLLDARVFDDELEDLISEKLQLTSFTPTNQGSTTLRGAELQLNLVPADRWDVFFVYAYLNNRKPSNPLERTQFSRHSGAAGITQAFGDGWRWSFAYYGASGDGLGENYYGREDLTLAKTFRIFNTSAVTTSLLVRRLDKKEVSYFRDFGDIGLSGYDDRLHFYGHVKVTF